MINTFANFIPDKIPDIITNPEFLRSVLPKIFSERINKSVEAVKRGHKFRITKFFLENVLDSSNPNDPLLDVVFPNESDFDVPEGGGHIASDREKRFTDNKHIVQKYTGSVIMMTTDRCPQFCTHCFRKECNQTFADIKNSDLEQIFSDLNSKTGDKLFDLILSGGEPLLLSPGTFVQMAKLKEKINSERAKRGIASLQISINTRMPVVDPVKILDNTNLMDALRVLKPMVMSIHILHPRERTNEFSRLMKEFAAMGIILKTNFPILKGVNDDPDVLVELFTLLADDRVTPRDLIHNIKSGIPESKCISLERTMEIARELSHRLPGTLMPKITCCTPEFGKSIVDPFHKKKDGKFGFDISDGKIEGLFAKTGDNEQPSDVF